MGLWSRMRSAARVMAGRPQPMPLELVRLIEAYGRESQRRIVVNEQARGIRTPQVPISLRWGPEQIEQVWAAAEVGDLYPLASLVDAMRLDGMISGLSSTKGQIARLPVTFAGGDPALAAELRGVAPRYSPEGWLIDEGLPAVWPEMVPVDALTDWLYTLDLAGVSVAELVPNEHGIPVFTPRDLHFLKFNWGERIWTYQGSRDVYEVRPGDGRWVLGMKAQFRPWRFGSWFPCGLPFVSKLASCFDRLRWQAGYADPLKYFEAGPGVSENYLKGLQDFIDNDWFRSPGIAVPPGYKPGLLQANGGEGYGIYDQGERWADRQIQVALAGQVVSVEGGKGFVNASIFEAIAEGHIQSLAVCAAQVLSAQVIRTWAQRRYSLGRHAPSMGIDVRSPGRRRQDAEVLEAQAKAIQAFDAMAASRGVRVDVRAYLDQNAIPLPLELVPARQASPALPPAPATPPALPPASSPSSLGTVAEEDVDLSELTA